MANDLTTVTSGELVEFDPNAMSYEQLAEMIGQQVGNDLASNIARLRINSDHADEQDRPLPAGSFFIHHPKKGNVYAKQVAFRPFMNRYQYVHFDPNENKFINKSVIFNDFRDEAPDEKGGLRAGKPSKKQRDAGLTAEQTVLQKQVQCFRLVYGTVSYTGKTVTGEEVEIVNFPVVLKLRGSNFMPIGDVLKGLSKAKKLMFNYAFDLTTKREKNGNVTYYVIQIEVDRTNNLAFTPDDLDIMKSFQEAVTAENESVVKKYEKALRNRATASDAVDATLVQEITSEPIDADFNDVIPDLG